MGLDDRGLLLALHQGVFEQPVFDSFLEQLRAHARASYVALTIGKTDSDPLVIRYVGERKLEQIRRKFLREQGIVPHAGRRMREGRVYGAEELFDPASRVHPLAHGDLPIPELAGLRVIRIGGDGVEASLACCGPEAKAAALSALLASLAPHLRVAIRAFATLDGERFRSRLMSDILAALDFAWLTLDAKCQIVEAVNAGHAFHQGLLRRGQSGRLVPASPAIERAIANLVKRFADGSAASAEIFNLSRDPPVDLLIAPLGRPSGPTRGQPVAIAYLGGGRSFRADCSARLAKMFALTPSEARLAWALVCGRSIAEAADDLDITVETARGYTKRIYAKTGLRGQVDLVRRVLTSVVALG